MPTNNPGNQPQSDPDRSMQDPLETLLTKADFSRANPEGRARLRQRLVAQAGRRPNRTLRLVFEVAGLGALAFFFLFAVTRMVEHQPLIPGALPPTPTVPRPTFTPMPAATKPSPTPQPLIDSRSTADEVRLAMTGKGTWNTLWMEVEIDYYPTSGDASQPENKQSGQAWLKKNGQGLVLTGVKMPPAFEFNLDVAVGTVGLYDGKKLVQYYKNSGQETSTDMPTGQTDYPLAGSSPVLDPIYPGFLWILSSEPTPLRMEFILNRWAVVADWGNSRLWIDSQTGLLLKVERYAGKIGESPLTQVITIRQVLINPTLDEAVFAPQHLNELTFRPAPGQTAALLQPSPTPWASYSNQGWIYIQAANPAPFDWQVFSLPASCLFDKGPCTKSWQVPDNPKLQITGMYWAPDHTRAIFSDTNDNQLVVLDVKSRQWLRVVQGFYQPQLTWSPDGTRIAALGEGVSAYDMGLVIVNPADWSVKDVPTTLKGEKRVVGWLDNNRTLLLQIMPQDNFKGGTPDWVATNFHPGFYRLDVETGQADPLLKVDVAQPLFDLTLTPDGRQLTYWQLDEKNVAWIYLAALDGSQITKTGLQGHLPTWSPDGQWLLFQQTRAADQNLPQLNILLLAHPDGSELQKVIASTATLETSWSPDSKYLLISEFDNPGPGSYSISLYDVGSGMLQKIAMPDLTNSAVLNLLGWEP
jgi:hypothetical protein